MPLKIKMKIAAGEPVVAVNVGGANPDIVEALARLGADIAFIDCERTGIGLDVATQLLRAARASGIAAVVRSWSKDPEVLVQYLDRKADGIVVPHVDSASEAAAIVELVRYACGKGAEDRLVVVQIETRAAVKAVDELAKVEGVDVFLIGPNDLAYDVAGTRGAKMPEVDAAIDHVCARLCAAGKRFGMPSRLEDIKQFQARGCSFLYYPVEWLLERAMVELKKSLQR